MNPPTVLREMRLPALDGVRGLAILGPLLERFNLSTNGVGPLETLFDMVADRGWIGVQLFFVLSGFLITGILLDSKGQPSYFRTFYVRRVLRIVPLYYATLIVALVLVPLIASTPMPDGRQIWLWLFLVNWAQALGGEDFGLSHFWSLAVEEQFYLIWPLVVLLTTRRQLAWLCLTLIVTAFASRAVLSASGSNEHVIYVLTYCRMDALAFGALGALALRTERLRELMIGSYGRFVFGSLAVALIGALATSGYALGTVSGQTVGYLVLSLAFLLLVTSAAIADLSGAGGVFAAVLRHRSLGVLGKYSYGMYVLHTPVHRSLMWLFPQWRDEGSDFWYSFGYIVFASGATFVLAKLAYVTIERPFLSLKSRWAPYAPS